VSGDTFFTIKSPAEGAYKEKGSRFLAYAFPVESEEQIKNHLAVLRKKYYDARHHCYAWILGYYGERTRANDDGEPSHSAGDPILGQIRAHKLTNVLVVVVRYFGGIKLGVGGLVNAYKTATADALDLASIEERLITETLVVQFGYPLLNGVMKIVKDHDLEIANQSMTLTCELTLRVRLSITDMVKEKLLEIHGVEVN
jgi:uncharacterized YigZ family protein